LAKFAPIAVQNCGLESGKLLDLQRNFVDARTLILGGFEKHVNPRGES